MYTVYIDDILVTINSVKTHNTKVLHLLNLIIDKIICEKSFKGTFCNLTCMIVNKVYVIT